MVETTLLGTALGVQTGSFMEVEAFDAERRAEFLAVLNAMRESGASFEDMYEQYVQIVSPWRGANIYYRTYQAKDGAMAVACLSDRLRKRVADVLGIDDPRFSPGYDPFDEETIARTEALMRRAEALVPGENG